MKKYLSEILPWQIVSKAGKYMAYRADLQKLDE